MISNTKDGRLKKEVDSLEKTKSHKIIVLETMILCDSLFINLKILS